MLKYDPVPWLMDQEGLAALRARRSAGLAGEGDVVAVERVVLELAESQLPDGSFDRSLLKTAGVLNLLCDLHPAGAEDIIGRAASRLMSVLEAQPGYERAAGVTPGSLTKPRDLCGFFGPYEDRPDPDLRAWGAREMNFLREYEPLLGPRSPVRVEPRSTFDRTGPGSCFEWGLVPLSYTLEALSRSGYGRDDRVQAAVNVLLGAQRESGGWCRNLQGHLECSLYALRALGAHPDLRSSSYATRALWMIHPETDMSTEKTRRWYRGSKLFAVMQAAAAFDVPPARVIIRHALVQVAPGQRRNGTFGTPHRVERVGAALAALRVLGKPAADQRASTPGG